jgi:hypothetical protein
MVGSAGRKLSQLEADRLPLHYCQGLLASKGVTVAWDMSNA